MHAAYDEIVTVGVKRSQGIERVIGQLLHAEIAAKQYRSNQPLDDAGQDAGRQGVSELAFDGSPCNGGLIERLSSGDLLDTQRNVVLVGGTSHGQKSHITIGIARSLIRRGRNALRQRCRPRERA